MMDQPLNEVKENEPEEEEELNEELKNKRYFISDRVIDQYVLNVKKLMIPNPFDIKYRKSIFHKYFIGSIQDVKLDCSRQELLSRLQQQLETGIYHFSFTDVDSLFKCIFYDLPNDEVFLSKPELMDHLFFIMNIFMFRFYDIAFPFFYNPRIDDNIFAHDDHFIINYFLKFSYRFHQKSVSSDKPYLNLLYEDGSMLTILNFLFDLYKKGDNLEILSDCIYKMVRWVDCQFLRDYLTKKHFFDKGNAIFINQSNNSIYRMEFPISFFLNYFQFNFPQLSTTFLRINSSGNNDNNEDLETKNEFSERSFEAINEMQIYNYLYTYLSSFIDQLIREGRLLNTQNPLSDGQSLAIDNQMNFYPEKAKDSTLYDILDLLEMMFRFIDDSEVPSCVLDFTPIILSLIKVIPGLFVSDWQKFPMLLFDYYRDIENRLNYDLLKETMIEAALNRITGNYVLTDDYNFISNMFTSDKKDSSIKKAKEISLTEINRSSINHFIQSLISNNSKYDPVCTPDEIIKSIHLEQVQDIKEWFYSIIKEVNEDKTRKDLIAKSILEYGYKTDDPDFIKMILYVFKVTKFTKEQYKLLNDNGFIGDLINLILKIPNLSENEDLNINLKHVVKFFNLFAKSKVPISDKLIEESYSIIMESGELFKIKLFSILLTSGNEERHKKYTDMIVNEIISNVMENSQGQIDDQSIQHLISISPLLSTFNFQKSEELFSLLKNSIDYINAYEEKEDDNFIIIDSNSPISDEIMKFESILDQFRVSLVLAMTHSFGFAAQPEYINLIEGLLDKYGMCIEVLNVISIIIGYISNSIGNKDIDDQLNETNKILFRTLKILLSHTKEGPEALELPVQIEKPKIDPKEEVEMKKRRQEEEKYRRKQFIKGNDCIINFALGPLSYEKHVNSLKKGFDSYDDDFMMRDDDDDEDGGMEANDYGNDDDDQMIEFNNCYYTYKMHGKPNESEEFSYIVNPGEYVKYTQHSKNSFSNVCNNFVRNMANYSISLLINYGLRNNPIDLIKHIVLIALRNGLISYDKFKDLLIYMSTVEEFYEGEEDINNWILACAQHATVLMISMNRPMKPFKKDINSPKLIRSNKTDQLKNIFIFFYKMNQNAPGCLSQEIIELMFNHNQDQIDNFIDFINSDEADMESKLDDIFRQGPPSAP